MIKTSERLKGFTFFGIALLTFIGGWWYFKDMPPKVDEQIHYLQVLLILNGTSFFPQEVPALPGYHWTLSFLSWMVHDRSGETLRFLSSCFSFVCLTVYFLLAKKIDATTASRRTSLLLFFPLLFPYWFLLYTDAYSMLFVLAALLCALRQRLWWAGFWGILSLLVRQNNLVWLGFIAALVFVESGGSLRSWQDLRAWSRKFAFFILAFALTALFVFYNKGLVFGDKTHHPLSVSLENLCVCLFFFFFLFFPHNLSVIKKGWELLSQKKYLQISLLLFFIAYCFFFEIRNFYNDPTRFGFFLHNRLLGLMTSNLPVKLLCFLPVGGALLVLFATPLARPSFYLVYPFTVLFLVPVLHVEHRYYFIPFSLFLLFKKHGSARLDWITLAFYIPTAIFLMVGIRAGLFFP